MIINSLSNPLIKEAVKLQKSNFRREQGLVIIDGAREVAAALAADWDLLRIFYCPSLTGGRDKALNRTLSLNQEKILEVSEAVFKKICYKEKPDGFLAIAKVRHNSWSEVKTTKQSLVIILEKVEKPGNLGAIIRTAYAAGVSAVVVNDNQTDIYNPNVIRASEGLVFSQALIRASRKETIEWLRLNQIKSYGAATNGARVYTQVDWRGPAAVIMGSEADGLGSGWLEAADGLIKIPMRQGIDSLNVSVATAVIIFEAIRQRS